MSTGQAVTINAKVKAGELLGGHYNSSLSVLSNDLDESEVKVDFDLTIIGVPNISIQDSLDFKTVFSGVTASRTLVISNTGSDQINVSSVDFSMTEFAIDLTSFTIPPKSEVERTIMFNSPIAGTFTSTMTVNSNDPDQPARTVILKAEAIDPPIIGVNPTFFDIALNSGDSTVQTLTISNTGGSDLDWSLSFEESTKFYTLTKPKSGTHTSDGKTITVDTKEVNPIKAKLDELTGARILYDLDISDYSTLRSDLELRGAIFTPLVHPLTDLSSYDIFITDDSYGSTWTSSEYTLMHTWVEGGGSLLIDGDNSENLSHYNSLIPVSSGILMNANGSFVSHTPVIYPHEITDSVGRVYSNAAGSWLSLSSPAEKILEYADGTVSSGKALMAVSRAGSGRVVIVGEELFYNTYISYYDNQLLANQTFDWLAGSSEPDSDITSGTIYAGSSQDVHITVHTKDMNAGEYSYKINIASNDPVNPLMEIPLKLVVITSIQDWSSLLPDRYMLKQNYPNPFNPTTTIAYGLPEQAEVSIEVFNMTGQKVETLINHKMHYAGYHKIDWNTQNLSGGIYFYRLTAIGTVKFSSMKKMILQK
ncbi:TPA: hypothetical protein DCR49_07510 [Candidatus Delongbacteria bacterium]|nr:hypothetical protein [Candidatus Delongbacteria bacterium]